MYNRKKTHIIEYKIIEEQDISDVVMKGKRSVVDVFRKLTSILVEFGGNYIYFGIICSFKSFKYKIKGLWKWKIL